jgi:type I restriction enzyme S subunit
MSNHIPDGWIYHKISDCCHILDSQRIPLNLQERQARKGIYPYYGANGVQGYVDSFIFDCESVLLAEDGGYFDEFQTRPIAQLASGRYWVNNHAHVLRANNRATTKWIFYALVHKDIQKFINGGTRAKLNQSDLKEIEIPIPPLKEQKKITSILSSVDEVIENTQAQIAKLEDLKKATMNELLTKGIGHTEFKETEIGRIPKSWSIEKLDDIALRGSGHTPSKQYSEYWNGGIKWVSLSDSRYLDNRHINKTTKEISELGIQNSSAVLHKKGTVILSRDAGVGKSAILGCDMAVSQHFITWYCKEDLHNLYLYYYLQCEKPVFEAIAMGSTIPTIGLYYFKKMIVPFPTKDEQIKISSILNSHDSQIESTNNKLTKLIALKKSLMQELLTGKVRVKVES